MTDLTKLSIAEARTGLKAKTFTALELTDYYRFTSPGVSATFALPHSSFQPR